MRTLREALTQACASDQPISLFRPGGFGQSVVWLRHDEVRRLHAALAMSEAA